MNRQELEEIYIRSLDEKLSSREEEQFLTEMRTHPDWTRSFSQHKKAREVLAAHAPASFSAYFASKLVYKIQNTGIVVDRQIFGMFKKLQLAAVGVIVVFLILNMVFSEQHNVKSVLGFEDDASVTEQVIPFDFSETFNTFNQ